jgi:predicted Zn-dependent protease
VTGKSQISLISESQEIQMGKEGAEQVKAQFGLVDDPALQRYVSDIGLALARKSERPELPWEFHVVDDPTVNAFALPGGYIFVTRGILAHMENEAELASVLGHEIGHVTYRHSVNQMSKAQLANLGLGVGSIFSETIARYGQVAGAGLQLLFLKYGRDAERESDLAGFRYALTNNYDVREMDDVFQTLSAVSQLEGAGRLPDWLSTHPNPEDRAQTVQQRLDTLTANLRGTVVDRDEFMGHLRRLTYGEDPREGYFVGSTFYHPALRFQLQFPEGWQAQNTKQAVIAGSPNQDAILQLTLGQGSPEQAAQQFFGQQGIQSSEVSRTTVNGNPAVSGYFQAQTEQGPIRGLVAFVSHGGATYQLMGYGVAQNFQANDAGLRQAIGSFRALSDQSRIDVEPAHIEIVQLQRAMTIEEFNRQYPSSIPIERVALINQVAAGEQLQAGRGYKRVVGGKLPQ